MGTAMRFVEAARAAFIANKLKEHGFGVKWNPEEPELLFTSAEKYEIAKITNKFKGTIDEWWKEPSIDVSSSR